LKLYYSPTSPYARKCRALVIEKDLQRSISFVEVIPQDNPDEFLASNPLGKVPALERDRGPTLVNSPLICEYIDSLNDENWIPRSGESRILVLRQQALADGLLDLTMGRRIEETRDEDLRWDFWHDRWEHGIKRTVKQLDEERSAFERSVDLGALSIAIALSYIDLRFSEWGWRSEYPALDEFANRWSERESFKRTEP
jgi:glutathione S-transferase